MSLNIPKEIVNEIATLVQPKYKCVRIEWLRVLYFDNGFKLTKGRTIFIIDYETKLNNDFGLISMDKNINDTEKDIIYYDSLPPKEQRIIQNGAIGKSYIESDYDEDDGLSTEYLEFKIIERF
jgi:hypothetical protein